LLLLLLLLFALTFEGGAVCGDNVLAQIPLVLHHLAAIVARHRLALDVHVDGVLLQVEGVGEGLEAVGADSGLHATPTLARVLLHLGGSRVLVLVLVLVLAILR